MREQNNLPAASSISCRSLVLLIYPRDHGLGGKDLKLSLRILGYSDSVILLPFPYLFRRDEGFSWRDYQACAGFGRT